MLIVIGYLVHDRVVSKILLWLMLIKIVFILDGSDFFFDLALEGRLEL